MTPEELLTQAAEKMVYPATPAIQLPVQKPPLAYRWVLRFVAVLMLIGFILLGLSPVRAAIWEIFQIGSVQVQVGEVTPVPNATLAIAGQTTLEKAQDRIEFPLVYPIDKGLPSEIFVQDWAGQMVVMVWREGAEIDLVLYQFDEGIGIYKSVENAVMTEVNGDFALWVDQPHILWMRDGKIIRQEAIYFVEGHVLIWDENGVTYRLESGLSLVESIQLAENLGTVSTVGGSTEER